MTCSYLKLASSTSVELIHNLIVGPNSTMSSKAVSDCWLITDQETTPLWCHHQRGSCWSICQGRYDQWATQCAWYSVDAPASGGELFCEIEPSEVCFNGLSCQGRNAPPVKALMPTVPRAPRFSSMSGTPACSVSQKITVDLPICWCHCHQGCGSTTSKVCLLYLLCFRLFSSLRQSYKVMA